MKSIESQLAAIAKMTRSKGKEVFVASGIRVGNQIITGSPVDKGHFINNWNTSINSISYASKPDNEGGSDSIAELNATFESVDIGQAVTFNNPVVYGPRLEYDGWSQKAKNGFVRINADKWPEIVAEEVLKRR
tara:strand:+ start:346 stop:744 length:399 start_codon:yes stop_codon:yes gene_type:complete